MSVPPADLRVPGPLRQDAAPTPRRALRSPADASSASGNRARDPALPREVWGRVGNLQGKGENQTRIWNR